MSGFAPLKPWAAAVVTNAAAPATNPTLWNATVADGGAGIYNYQLNVANGLDAAEAVVLVEPRTVDLTWLVTHTDDDSKIVTFADLMGADTDALHAVVFCQIDPGLAV